MQLKTFIFVFGTRPELIKMAPLILESKRHSDIKTVICSTGQHRDMLASLYELFQIKPDVDFKLMKPNQSLVSLHAEAMFEMQKLIESEKPNWVIVQGDTTTAHAAAMAAFYMKVPVAHVEAGLRTYDIHSPFPEEMNRRAIGLIAKAHLCPTQEALSNLKSEKTDSSSFCEVTGNTGIDSLKFVSERIASDTSFKSSLENRYNFLNLNNFALATMHRRENFGEAQQEILKAFLNVSERHKMDIIFPVHPNPNVRSSVEKVFLEKLNKQVFWVNDKLDSSNLTNSSGRIFLLDPIDYASVVFLMQKARLIMTDSGGLQEEAPTFKKKIIVLRNSTERPEGVTAGFSELVGTDREKIEKSVAEALNKVETWALQAPVNPYGDGAAAVRIIKTLKENS